MQRIDYDRFDETLYYERLPNGLDVFILPKPGFIKTYATFSTRYGSMDNHFQIEECKPQRVPDGIAHFLEHKMFEEPEGDVFAKFSSLGASANAYTSFDRTVYLFSATEKIEENLMTLLDFVQRPHFTDENVEKEKGIIEQEIKMYRDHPDWRSYYGLIEAMYQAHPVRIDIAGTVESIRKITKDLLYECYRAFYHPGNMQLFIVGGVDPERLMERVRENQSRKDFGPKPRIRRYFAEEPDEVGEPVRETVLPVSLPKCLLGMKEPAARLKGKEFLRRECEMKMVLGLLFGPSSSFYQTLYDEGLITDQFGFEYNFFEGASFSVIGGETPNPEELVRRVREEVDRVLQEGFSQEDFERYRNKQIGAFFRMLNSPETIAHEFTKYRFKNADLFDLTSVYESLTLSDVNRRLREHFDWSRLSVSIVRSEAK